LKRKQKKHQKILKQLKIPKITTKHSLGMYLSVEKERHPTPASRRDASNNGGIPTACQAWKMLFSTER